MYLLLADTSNLYYSVKRRFNGKLLDYRQYLDYIEGKLNCPRFAIKVAYGNQDCRDAVTFIKLLQSFGFITNFAKDADWTVNMVITVMTHLDELTTVVLGSNTPHLIPLIQYLKIRGIRVIVYASGIPDCLRDVAECIEINNDNLNFDFTTPDPKLEV